MRKVFVLMLLTFLPGFCWAQTDATLSGRVSDPTGAAIAGAEVVLTNVDTNVEQRTRTNSEGLYVFPGVHPGNYRVAAGAAGFKTLIKENLVLQIQDEIAENFSLTLGSVSESVTVNANELHVNTTDATVSTVVDQTYVANMPLNGRSFQDLILLTPGTATQSPQNSNALLGQTGEFSVNGQRPEENYYTVDGVSANLGTAPGTFMLEWAGASGSVPLATALGTTQGLVSVDDLQEFRVQTSTYSAQYGRNPGGQISFETKSGNNEWHGTGFEYLRNGVLDANDWFNDYLGVKEAALRQNDFGGTLGGPAEVPGLYNGKDRTFFFVSYEGLRLVQPQEAQVNYVPDSALRATTPAPLQQALGAFPVANGRDFGDGMAEFLAGWSNPSSVDSTSVRFDHRFGDKLVLFFRFADTSSNSKNRGTGLFSTPAILRTSTQDSHTYTGGATSSLTDHLSNEFRMNYASNQVTSRGLIDEFGGNTPVDLAQMGGLPPSTETSVVILYGGYEVALGQGPESAVQRQWNLVDTVSYSWKRHFFKAGADYRRLTPIATPFNPFAEYLYLSESSIQVNSALAVASSYAPAYPLYQNLSAFVQDEWKVTSRLSLSLGLRWEVNPAPGVTKGLKPYTIEGSTPSEWTLAPQGTPLWNTTWHNLAPRLGAAYLLGSAPGFETVVRGGAGIFYDTGQQMGSFGFEGPGFSALVLVPSASFPLPAAQATPFIINPPVAPYSAPVVGFQRDLQLPYTIQWNAAVEQGLGKSQALTVSYVGSHAARLPQENEFDGPTIGNPNASAFFLFQNALTSDYDALQLQFRRSLSRGLTVLSSYTWSHCIDYQSQNYLYSYQRGSCDFDVRHNLSAALSYDLPGPGDNRLAKALLRHWGVDNRLTVRTAFPVTLNGLANPDPATGQYLYSGLNLVPGQPVYIYGAQCAALYDNGRGCPGGRAINPNAFAPPASGLGDAPRNFLRGFGAWQYDLAVRREFPIYERLKLQFRAEAFNIFNHPNFGAVNPSYCSAGPGCTFGQATGTLASASGILSPLYQMGGPRSMQFALRLTF